jgi:hypothetical protein
MKAVGKEEDERLLFWKVLVVEDLTQEERKRLELEWM